MKGSIENIISLLIFTLLLSGCTERIEIDLDESYSRLVVDGAVTTDTTSHKVFLTKTTSYFYNSPPPRISGAAVTLTFGNRTVVLSETEPGIYCTDSMFYGIPEQTYILNIKLSEPVGGYAEYTASSYLNSTNSLDSIQPLFHPDWSEEGFWELKSYFADSPTDDYYRFVIYRNGKAISDTLDEWFVMDDAFFNGSYAYGMPVYMLDQADENEILNSGDIITVEMNSIGRSYAEFLSQSQSEIWGSNPLFSGPPANVKGNISNGAIGFFAAYPVSRATAKIPVDSDE